jgi:transcriptional regulator GlxA family with amidase domain
VPGGAGVEAAQHDLTLRAWLVAAEPRVRRLGSACSGALILARAGLLDGLAATTHWSRLDELRTLGQGLRVDGEGLHTFDARDARRGHVFTSAGVTAGIDLALALVEADAGRSLALAVARHLVMFVRRPGGQAQFSPLLTAEHTQAPRLASLLAWIPGQLDKPLTLDELAAQACMSPRTLARLFARELGTTPARHVARVRLHTAATLLSQQQASVATVARLCGFGHPENLRRSFHKHLAVSPRDFAQRFGG